MSNQDGGPAFPSEQTSDANGQWNCLEQGMSVRYWTAVEFACALVSRGDTWDRKSAMDQGYEFADLMVSEEAMRYKHEHST